MTTLASETVDVVKLRHAHRVGYHAITQLQFARLYGFTLSAVKDWEQRRRKPSRTAQILLTLIERNQSAVQAAIGDSVPRGLRFVPPDDD